MFTRQLYDANAYKQDLTEWTGPGKYYLMPTSTHLGSDTCFQEIPEMHAANKQYKISSPHDMVNIESDLFNLNRLNSKDQFQKYPFIKPTYKNPPGPLPVCCGSTTNFAIRYPKLEGSQYNREQEIHVPRFESLCLNPQQLSRIRSNNVIGLNTRLFNRDRHRCGRPVMTNKTNVFA